MLRLQVLANLRQRSFLGSGQLEGQIRSQPRRQGVAAFVDDAARLVLDPVTAQRQRELQQKDLLEGQRALRKGFPGAELLEALGVGWEVHVAQRAQPIDQPVAREDFGRHPRTDGLGLDLQRVIDVLDELERRLIFLFRPGGREVVWAYPITVADTPHRLVFSTGERLNAA